jgi:hypothetical protein
MEIEGQRQNCKEMETLKRRFNDQNTVEWLKEETFKREMY